MTRGTDPHIFLVRALLSEKLTEKDITPVLLQHPDGKTALIRGDVDAWAGLDPMMAQAEVEDGARLFYRNKDANTWGILNVREEFLKDHPDLVKRVLAVYEEARKYSLANYDEEKRVFIAATKLPDAVVDKQLKERTDLTHSKIGAPQRDSILAAGLALQQAGVIKADVDVEGTVDALIDSERAADELTRSVVPGRAERRERRDRKACLAPGVGMSFVSMTIAAGQVTPEQRKAARDRLARWSRPAARPDPAGRGSRCCGNSRCARGFASGRLVPPPSVIFATFWELAQTGELQRHALATCLRVAAGFGIGVVAGTLAGAITGYSALMQRLLDPTLQALRAIPSIAWVPLFVLWFGIFEGSKITLIAVGVFFPVYLGVMGAIMSVDRKLVEVGRAFRLSDAAMVRRILLPAVLPAYVLSLRSGLGLGWMFVVAAELLGASEGLGYLLIDGQQLGKPAQIVAAIVAFAIIGKTTDWIISAVAAPFLRWEDAFVRR